jgi:hypothetical protein
MDEGVAREVRYVERRLAELGGVRLRQIGEPNPPRYKYPAGSTHKHCTRCKGFKSVEEFSPMKYGALGKNPKCKACNQARYKEGRESKAGRVRPNACECCGENNWRKRPLHFDHDHVTNEFRGWLCHDCNMALGAAKDSIERLKKLIDYLNRTRRVP